MLPAQVSYWTLQENKRHNMEQESIGKEQNRISQFTAEEQQRHNQESESISWYQTYETQRHNIRGEDISEFSAQETARHNVQQENIGYMNAAANTKQAQAAMYRAKTDRARYKLEKKEQPYKFLKYGAEASRLNAEADYIRGPKTVNTNAQTYKTQVDIAQVPFNMKVGVWDRINDAIGNMSGIVRAGVATQNRRSNATTNNSKVGGKTNVKTKKTKK